MIRSPGTYRFWVGVVLVLLPFTTVAVAGPSVLDNSAWTNYTNINTITDLQSRGDTVWLATTGGLVYFADNDPAAAIRITNKEGLGHNTLRFVAFGPDGAVWTGGAQGRLSRRWSDVGWSVYPFVDDDAPIALNTATAGPGDFLWVGSDVGVHKFDIARNGGEIKETYTRIGNWTSSSVSSVHIAGGRIWVAGPAGIATADVADEFLLDPSRWMSWSDPVNAHVIVHHDSTVYAGASDGLWRFEGNYLTGSGSWQLAGLSGLRVNDLHSRHDTLWIATQTGVGFVVGEFLTQPPLVNTESRPVTALTLAEDEALWFTREDVGISSRTSTSVQSYEFDGPVDNDIVDVAVGGDDRVWFVHRTRGVDYLDPTMSEWEPLPYSQTFVGPSAPATGVDVAPNGDVWVSMFGSGALQINADDPLNDYLRYDTLNSSLMFVTDPGGANNFVVVTDVAVDDRGRVWFANAFADSGARIAFNDDGCWGRFGTDDDISSNAPQVIETQPDRILIGFGNAGIAEFAYREPLCSNGVPSGNSGTFTLRNTFAGLPTDEVLSILVDRADSLWVGTSAGLVQWNSDFRRFLPVALPLDAGLSINAVAADAFNTIWVGTGRGLVARYSNGDTELFTPLNSPLVGEDVRAIAIDDRKGVVWVATGSGVTRLITGAAPAESANDVIALPNPFEVVSGGEREVRFNAPFGSRVYIYTVAGDPVFELDASQGWNGRNHNGALVASGVYLFVVRGPSGDYGRGKLAVIRTN